jgi:hypothetical protein
MEFTYNPKIVKEIVSATQFLNCNRIFNELKINTKLSEEDFQKYLDYCEINGHIEKMYFTFNNEQCHEYITTIEGEKFIYGV